MGPAIRWGGSFSGGRDIKERESGFVIEPGHRGWAVKSMARV